MKAFRVIAIICICSLGMAWLSRAQQGPKPTGSETVAKPKKKGDAAEPDLPKIPSKFEKKDKDLPQGVPTFKTDVTTVTVDVAVLDNKGHFIPKIPKGNFRILEDSVPQQLSGYSVGEAPMTIAMVIEFSNRYQRFYSEPWYQTLTAAYGFLESPNPAFLSGPLVSRADVGVRLPGKPQAGDLGGVRRLRPPVWVFQGSRTPRSAS